MSFYIPKIDSYLTDTKYTNFSSKIFLNVTCSNSNRQEVILSDSETEEADLMDCRPKKQ